MSENNTASSASAIPSSENEAKRNSESIDMNEEKTAENGGAIQPEVLTVNAVVEPPANTTPPKPIPPGGKVKPGEWGAIPRQEPVDPDTAKARIEARPLPTKIYKPKKNVKFNLGADQVKSLAPGFASNTVGGPASIAELARALRNDVDLIFEWVFNNVENHITYGLQKGGLGAIIDGFGNSFDQSDLMIQLLRQAGYTANYQNGTLRMNGAQAATWLGTDPANVFAAANTLANCLVPVTTVWDGTQWVMDFSHTWVKVTIGGTDYVFDPALKTYTAVSGINLGTAMSYNSSTFMSNATSGSTITADYVQNINRSNIRNDLDTMAGNLVSWIKTNNHGASMDDILGGRTINQYDAASPLRQTTHPYLKPSTTPTTWTSIAQAYKTTLHVVYDTIDETFNSEDLAGKRLTLFFNGSLEAELRLDGTLIATSSAQGVGTWNSALMEIVHPYPYTWADQSTWFQIWADKPYLLCHSFGHTSRSASQIHSRNQKKNLASGLAATSEPVLGELMATTWKMWDAGGTQLANIINRMTNTVTANHHAAGIIGWFDTPFTNVGMVKWSTGALDNNYNNASTNDTVLAMHGVAMEAQIFNQMAGIDGVSTTPLVDIANSGGMKIYDGSSANWTANVAPNLTNYAPSDVADIKSWWIDNGYRVGIPEDGQITRGSWTGFGYYAIPTFGTFGIIQGGLKGGGGACYASQSDWVDYANYRQISGSICGGSPTYADRQASYLVGSSGYGGSFGAAPKENGAGLMAASSGVLSSEPIDMMSGDYLLGQTDITIGSQGFPYGLGFSRSYNSRARFQDGPLGWGWTHNWQMYAQKATDALMGMGSHSTLAAAAAITELFVAVDIQTDLTKPFNKYITCALASQWFIDNLIDNGVLVSSGQCELVHIKLRDGSYTSPNGDNGAVSFVSGAWKYTSLDGGALNFSTDGTIATMTSPAGMTITFGYTSGKLTSVTNGLGRTLTLSYTGNRLTSVSDGTGRSVGYIVDGSGNLTTVTDPNSKNWTFEYDAPGRMTKHFYPANPTTAIAVNTYDTLDRVKEQRDYQSNLWQYFFAGSRSQELNPNSKGSVIYMNGMGKVVKTINQVGKISRSVYDGRGRVTKTIAPELNSFEFVYDIKDRVTLTTAKAKPGSGLSDIANASTYDVLWNRLKTATDNMGRVTTLNYDSGNGNLLSVVSPSVTGLGSSTISMTYNARGQLLTVTLPDGSIGKNNYDSVTEKLVSRVTDYGTGRLNLTISFAYNNRGDLTDVQDPLGNTASVSYDTMRRVIQTVSPLPFSYLTNFTYDDNGNRVKVERQTGDPLNPWQTSQISFSADNKPMTATDPQGNTVSVTYDSLQRQWKITDSLARVIEYVYDDANRIASIKDPSGTTAVTYTYRDNGGISSIKDARNCVTTHTVDGHDRAARTTYPDGSYEQVSSRDGNSNPLALVTRSGATISLAYDELNRVITKTPTGEPAVTTVYDIAGRVTTVSTPVVSGDPSSGIFTNFYDGAGRFYKEQYPDGLTVVRDLDANGNVVKITYPDGYYIQRVFDQVNRLTDIKLNGAGTSALRFEYDALSRRTKLLYENGCSTNYGFEVDNDMSLLYLNFVGSSVGFSYGFDSANQMLKQGTTDPANFRWTPGSPATASYGTANNLNQYPTVGGTSQTYSTDGCLTNDGVYKYEFSPQRLLTRVRNAGTNAVIAEYLYDPGLRQRQKNVAGTKTNYYYAGWQRLADYDGTSNTLQQRYVYGASLDEVLIQIAAGGTKTYFHANHQGSLVAKTDSFGAVSNTYKYGPFGESTSLSGTTHGYTGQRFDVETGLYYFKFRHYSPKLGRFLQPDPIGYAAGLNMYSYCENAPLTTSDPMGLTDFASQYNFFGAPYNMYQGTGIFGGGGSSKSAGPSNSSSSSSAGVGAGSGSGLELLGIREDGDDLIYEDEYRTTVMSAEGSIKIFGSSNDVFDGDVRYPHKVPHALPTPDINWGKLDSSTKPAPLGKLFTAIERHNYAVKSAISFLKSQGVKASDIYTEVPFKIPETSPLAYADIVYQKDGVWEVIEVKTSINDVIDSSAFTVNQQNVYPHLQLGQWEYPDTMRNEKIRWELTEYTPVNVRVYQYNVLTHAHSVIKSILKILSG